MFNREQHFEAMAEGLRQGPMYVSPREHRRPPTPLHYWEEKAAQGLIKSLHEMNPKERYDVEFGIHSNSLPLREHIAKTGDY